MSNNRLQVGIDFGQATTHFCLLRPDGQPLELHHAFANSLTGYTAAKKLLLQTLATQPLDGLDISGEATGFYWLPFFLQLATDPELEPFTPQLFLLNPRWVHWFKKCFAQDDKSDQKDPYYIAERLRTRRPAVAWTPQLATLPLRFYTRLRFHLIESLVREKNYLSAFLFLQASAYRQLRPFTNVFAVTSRWTIGQLASLDDLAALPVETLAAQLNELSRHRLPDPVSNAQRLQQVAAESLPLPAALTDPVQRILDLSLEQITYLEGQIETVDHWIATEVETRPAIAKLMTIPGVGPVFAAGLGAEIGDIQHFLQGTKWDAHYKAYRPKNLRDAEDAVAKTAGLWWPRTNSGDFEAEDRRMAKTGNRYLRYYFVQAADKMRQHIPDYAAFYQRKYREVTKHQHKRAVVLTARKSVGLIVGLLHRNEAYRPSEA
jgi:Transposase/Transposase IS116/IS110/IS902 family